MDAAEVVIIGGGIAGLYTAFTLQKADVSYLLFEAKSTFGGRIAGQPLVTGSELSVDLGPTWFWPHQKRLKLLLKELHLEWFEQYSRGDALYHLHPEELVSRISGDTGRITSCRVKGGMQKLVFGLAARLDPASCKTGHAATRIERQNDSWRVTVEHQGQEKVIRAKQLVLALPPRLIAGGLGAEQFLSRELINSLQAQQTWMSAQAKFVAVYKKPFWRNQGLSGDGFSRVGPLIEIHDGSSAAESGFALFGFIGLPPGVRSQLGDEQLTSLCLAQLELLFGAEAQAAEACYLKDWAQDKWVATDQDIMEAPRHPTLVIAQHNEELRSLGLHLAASECAPLEAGYLEGALLAADAAVQRFLDCSAESG